MRRLIERDLPVAVVEASGGTQALDLLLKHDVDFVIMDVVMPVMNGLETLTLMRRSPRLAALPVVMLTGMPDEQNVRKAIELKVVEFVAKPVSPAHFRERIAPLIAGIQRAKEGGGGPLESGLDLSPERRVVFIDRQAEHRSAAAAVLARLCRLELLDNEFAGLTRALEEPPDVMFLGLTSGLATPDELVGRIRSHATLRHVRLVGLVQADAAAAARESGLYQCVIGRAATAAALERGLERHVTPETRARLLLHGASDWAKNELLHAVREELGAVAGRQVSVRRERTGAMAPRWAVATGELACGGLLWGLRVESPFTTAIELAKIMHRGDVDEVTEDDAVKAISTVAERLARRIRAALELEGLEWRAHRLALSLQGAPAAASSYGHGAASWRFVTDDGVEIGIVSLVPGA